MYLQAVTPETERAAKAQYHKFGFPDDYINNLRTFAIMENGHVIMDDQGRFRLTTLKPDEIDKYLGDQTYEKLVESPLIDLVSWSD